MQKSDYRYLIHLQYLGFRYHGWAVQPQVKTVQGQVHKTLRYIFPDQSFKLLGAGRTDAMVSATQAVAALFMKTPQDTAKLLELLNENLPADIRATRIEAAPADLNVIGEVKLKTYHYVFAFGTKAHPFAAPLVATFPHTLDVALMAKGARYFEGEHDFGHYCQAPKAGTEKVRRVESCTVIPNMEYRASFFPEKTYLLVTKGRGFMHHQIRLMMGALVLLGRGELTLRQLEQSLQGGEPLWTPYVAPASGLVLAGVSFGDR